MKFLYPLNLTKNELLNARIQNLPESPNVEESKVGQIYYDTTDQKLKIFTKTGSSPDIFEWRDVGANNTLGNDILEGHIDGKVLTYKPYTSRQAGKLYTGTTDPISIDRLNYDGYFYATRFNNLTLSANVDGFQIAGGTTSSRTLSISTGNVTINGNASGSTLTLPATTTISALTSDHVLYASAANTIAGEAQLAVSRGGTNIGEYTKGDILYSSATNTLSKLSIGDEGQTLRVNSDGVPYWATGGSVDETLVIKFDDGTTEGTDLYTYDGSVQKTFDFIAGNKVSLTTAAGSITIDHDEIDGYSTEADDEDNLVNIELLTSLNVDDYGHVDDAQYRKLVAGTDLGIVASSNGNITFNHDTISFTPTTSSSQPDFQNTFNVIDGITVSNQGHVTAVNTKTVTMPTETTLSKVDDETGTWLTDITVSDHQITLSRSNSTQATITVGELVVSDTGTGNGNVTIAGNLTVNGTTTTINTETVEIEDNLILINKVDDTDYTPPASLKGGLQIYRGDLDDYKFVFVEETEDFRIGMEGYLQPVLTRDESENLTHNDLLVWDADPDPDTGELTNYRAVTKSTSDLGIPRKFAVTQAIETGETYTITHNLGTEDVTITLKDNATKEVVYAAVKVMNTNSIQFTVGEINSVSELRVIVIG